MPKDKVVVGIDIGSSKVATVVATLGEDFTPNIIGVASYPARGVKKKEGGDIDGAVLSIAQSVEAAERMAGYSIGTAFVSVDGSHVEPHPPALFLAPWQD